jgi:hypothetical protein
VVGDGRYAVVGYGVKDGVDVAVVVVGGHAEDTARPHRGVNLQPPRR